VTRGINRQDIFCDQDDYQRFLGTLARVTGLNKNMVFKA